MNILIISNSLVVLELFKKVAHEEEIEAEFVNSVFEATNDSYSAIFIDDILKDLDKEIEYIQNHFDYNYLIIIGKDSQNLASLTLPKPFLITDIKEILKDIKEESSEVDIKSVLDINEIEKIKKIMQEQERENSSKRKSGFKEALKEHKNIKAKNKEAKKLISYLCKMDKKELQKLFKEAKITLKIEFKDA